MDSRLDEASMNNRPLASSMGPEGDLRCGYPPSRLPHVPEILRGRGDIAPEQRPGALPNLVSLLQAAESSSATKRRLPPDEPHHEADERGKRPRTNARASRTYPRRRALVACEICRTRKTKCDNQRPTCGSCLALGCNCSYADTSADHSTFDPASLAILERLNYAVRLLESQASRPQDRTPPSAQPPAPFAPTVDEEAHEIETLELSVPAGTPATQVLEWPILGNKYDRTSLDTALFVHPPGIETAGGTSDLDDPADAAELQSLQRCQKPGRGILEEEVPSLVQKFLENVHIKNPVVDSADLKRWAKAISRQGFGWNTKSCLVLIACALGVLSSPFDPTRVIAPEESSLSETENYTTAETYYNASRKRTGLLGNSLVAAECFFLSGVYEMYSLRPLQAFQSFNRAAGVIQVFKLSSSYPTTPKPFSTVSLEHRLYWSCLKSISEIREQLPLPPSGLASLDYPLFPTLPATVSEPNNADSSLDSVFEKSWFYYLAEISSRRIANRILNAFYKGEQLDWLSSNLENMIGIALELESQIDRWSEHVPQPVSFSGVDVPQEELAFMTQARQVHMYMFLYRPFLFIAVHTPRPVQLDPRVKLLAEKCLQRCLQHASSVGIKHRHHGTYFAARSLFSVGLILLASAKSRKIDMPPDWRMHLDHILAFLKYWELETSDLARGRQILLELAKDVMDIY